MKNYKNAVSAKTMVIDLKGAIKNSQIIYRNAKGIISNKMVGPLKAEAAKSKLRDPLTKYLDAGLKKAEANGFALQVTNDSMSLPEIQYVVNQLEEVHLPRLRNHRKGGGYTVKIHSGLMQNVAVFVLPNDHSRNMRPKDAEMVAEDTGRSVKLGGIDNQGSLFNEYSTGKADDEQSFTF